MLPMVEKSIEVYYHRGIDAFCLDFHTRILKQKVRFPALEYATLLVMEKIPERSHLEFAQNTIALREIGSNVVAGMVLQKMAEKQLPKAFTLAGEFIVFGGEWYCCDIMAERVMGVSLLNQPDLALKQLQKLSTSKEELVVRTIGVAAHYAVKKGLQKPYVEEVFKLLLSLGNATEFHVKTGIGWGAKTCAKFHPDVVRKHEAIYNDQNWVGQWFRSKLAIGFSRNYKYATRYTN